MTLTIGGAPTVTTVDGRGFAVRHVRPGTGEGSSTVTVLGRAYGFEWLPMSTLPSSPDLVEGSYTRRLGDAGEFTLTFPNVASSKGLWREKFSEAGALEFVEIYRDGALEFVGCIERVEIDRGSVTISGGDGWSLLKRAYERDREWWDAPATVIDAYTRVPVVRLAEDWADTTGWTLSNCGLAANHSGFPGDYLETPTGSGSVSASARYATLGNSYYWYAETTIDRHIGAEDVAVTFAVNNSTTGPDEGAVIVTVGPNGWSSARVVAYPSTTITTFGGEASGSLPAKLRIERRGRFFYAYVNSTLIGVLETSHLPNAGYVFVRGDRNSGTAYALIGPVSVTYHEPFLRRGSDRGDLVLPGDYPPGGLRGRYFNYGDLQGLASGVREGRAFAPTREPYAERLDPQIDTSTVSMPVRPGADTTYWAARWTGSIYLPQSAGAVSLRVVTNGRVRAWVGGTEMDETLWLRPSQGWVTGTTAADTITPTDDGWYPIRVEFIHATGTASLQLQFYRATGWTDPGGTTISNATWTVVPSTSLSPLGCHEARIQGQSHFQIVQDAAAQAGYELLLEPMSLESGEFPGRLVPRLRVGTDTDVLLEVEDTDTAEPILSPAVTRDSSDQAVRFIGAGSGNADGRGSQTIAEVADLTADALFELQAWADAGDATLPQLLEARLNAELALRATPWEEVRGTPRGIERLADTWPLTGSLSVMRWQPGDGLRIAVPDIGVIDTEPRRLTQVTRAFAAEGRTATTVGFRQRPRSAAVALKRLAQSQALALRSNQGTPVTLTSDVVEGGIAAGSWTAYAFVSLLPQDTVRRAILKVNQYTGTGTLSLAVNGADRTSALGGSWSTAPLEIDVTAYATQASTSDNRLYARMQQTGGNAGQINLQLVVEVLR